MKTKEPKTKVLFRMFQGEVLALFPRDAATVGNPFHCSSYESQGQHGAADLHGVIQASRPATLAEFRGLARELRRIGYRLDVRHRTGQADLVARREQLA